MATGEFRHQFNYSVPVVSSRASESLSKGHVKFIATFKSQVEITYVTPIKSECIKLLYFWLEQSHSRWHLKYRGQGVNY
jgi:hypothetical protein